ncbi:MAG: exodeoxyribonuclease III [Planctomycetota bacterium]
MLCVAWNVNGLRAIAGKGFLDWLASARPDVLCLQETRASAADLDPGLREPEGYRLRVHPAQKKGYSGVAIYVREEPDEWIEGLGDAAIDDEGRFLAARYGDLCIASAYFPNSQEAGARLPFRLAYGAAIERFAAAQRKRKRHVAIGGDYNVAHQEIDLARPKQNVENPGFLPGERDWMTRFLDAGHVDTWRRLHPGEVGYSWWSMRSGARARNIGWRLDYFCVDEGLWPRVRGASILSEVQGSDHCPVTLELERGAGR